MPEDREILLALLREASQQSESFQSLIHDFSLDVMNDPEVHDGFTTRLNADPPMLRRIDKLKTFFKLPSADSNEISKALTEVLEAACALPAISHTNLAQIA